MVHAHLFDTLTVKCSNITRKTEKLPPKVDPIGQGVYDIHIRVLKACAKSFRYAEHCKLNITCFQVHPT